ncbi:hypothetical protein [Hyalangium rubrum]|uniref:Outer membrane protein beta-barrel domain-containing protein n=1 Tax=Hyalangium rubrum TaxID=3103134 RepID=A0ABU5H1I5_9BACT|nr:hypothetical protein [Hyalangium sp. s54d21]MDY7227299.1 hypothetical protein [Hyalangium sp. s54d21]
MTLALSAGVASARPATARSASARKAPARKAPSKAAAAKAAAAKAAAEKAAAEQASSESASAPEKVAAEPPAPTPSPAAKAVDEPVSPAKASAEPPAAAPTVLARKTAPAPAKSAPARPSAAPSALDRPMPTPPASAPPSVAKMRIGVGFDLFAERSTMTGEQAINASRLDESFDYSSGSFLSATLSLSVPAPIASDNARIGGGVRLFGNYGAGGDRTFGFGLLNQAFISGEYGLPVAQKMEAMFGIRGGLSLLVPGRQLSDEIHRLQDQGVDVWNVPRVGWLLGLSLGARRQMSERILLRADLGAQLEKLFLFSTSQEIDGLQFNKDWSTFGLRLGLTLGIEFAL